MDDLGHHIMLRSDDDRVLAPSPPQRRALATAVYRVAKEFPLLAFGAADNHLHLEALCDRATAGALAHRVMCSLHWALDFSGRFSPVRIKRLEDQGHLRSTFHYTLNQRNHHGVQSDPFLDGSSLPELLGLRLLPTDSVQLVREHFPRLQRGGLLRHLGSDRLDPARGDQLIALVNAGRHDLLRDAAAAVVGAPDLRSKQPEVVAAATTLVQLLAPCCSPPIIGEIVQRSRSRVRHMRSKAPSPPLEHAIRLQLGLRLLLLETHLELMEANDAGPPR